MTPRFPKLFLRTLTFLASLSTVVACASRPKSIPGGAQVVTGEEQKPAAGYERGVRALDAENYAGAAEEFDHLLVAKPASEMDLATLFNSGAAYEGLGQCPKASERYREVVRSSAGKFPRIEAQALYRMSLAFECMGDDQKTVVALLEARRHADELPLPIARAELPARLAAAYNRLGNRAKAVEFFGLGSQGLKDVLAAGSSARAQKETLAKTLYGMGRLNATQRRGDGDPIAFLQSLSMQQPYLLQAIEMRHPHWAKRAAEDLIIAYDNLIRFRINDAQRRREYLTRAVQVLNELRRIRMPEAGATEDDVFANVDKVERRLATQIAEQGETTRLTPEAERRDSLKQSGRLTDPAPPTKKGVR